MKQLSIFLLPLLFSVFAAGNNLDLATLGTPDIDDIEYPDDEEHSSKEIELGKMLFFDQRLSKNNNQSCATCHNPDLGFSDGLSKGLGTHGNRLGRNAPHLYNLAWASTFFWDGRASTLEEQALGPIQAEAEMGMSLNEVTTRLNKVATYRKVFKDVYGKGISAENIGKAIAAFERTLISNNSAFDQYIAGNKNALSPSAERGLALFVKEANCVKCHDGPNFTDDSFHNIGVGDEDQGRSKINGDKTQAKAFKTPGLRNIVFSAPYFHDGSAASLEEVIELYNKGGHSDKRVDSLIKPLNLTDLDKADLVAFLGALTDPVDIIRPQIPK